MGTFNTDILINYLLFGGYTLVIVLIVFFVTRYCIEHHLWVYHLPEKTRVNLETRDRIEHDQDIKIEMLEEKIRQQNIKILYMENLSKQGEVV